VKMTEVVRVVKVASGMYERFEMMMLEEVKMWVDKEFRVNGLWNVCLHKMKKLAVRERNAGEGRRISLLIELEVGGGKAIVVKEKERSGRRGSLVVL